MQTAYLIIVKKGSAILKIINQIFLKTYQVLLYVLEMTETVNVKISNKDTRIYIIDRGLHIVPDGEIGEICSAGKGFA